MKSPRRGELSWSELPPELLSAIAERLETRTDILHFRRVCKTWRTSTPLSLISSKSILSPLLPYKFTNKDDIIKKSSSSYTKVLSANSVFLIRPLQGGPTNTTSPWLFTGEELSRGCLTIRHPLSGDFVELYLLPCQFPDKLDLSEFHVVELGMFYSYNYRENTSRFPGCAADAPVYSSGLTEDIDKVVLFVNPDCGMCPTIDDCVVVELNIEIPLSVKCLKNGENRKVYFPGKREIDDIVCFKGRIYAVDHRGMVCAMDINSLKMSSVTSEPLSGKLGRSKKLMAVSSDNNELYLVNRWSNKGKTAFTLYKLNEAEKKWDKVNGLGSDRMLFVTPDGCFFASVKDFPGWRGNCIVFPRGSFPQYTGKTTLDDKIFRLFLYELPIAVFYFDSGDCSLLREYPDYYDLFWPPMPWLWSNAGSKTKGTDVEGGEQKGNGKENIGGKVRVEGEEEQQDCDKIRSDYYCFISDTHGEMMSPSPDYVQVAEDIQIDQHHLGYEEVMNQENIDSIPVVKTSHKIAEKDASQVKFLGVDVSPHLVPVLQKIWDKYGNIIEGHVVNSESLLSWALESLAKIIIILEDNLGRSLDDSQVDYLNAILLDLQLMHFKLDWIVPFIDNVLALEKNKVFMELEKTKSKLQTKFHQMEERSAERTKLGMEGQIASAEEPCLTLNLLSFLETH